jgi:hypothetical protein
VIFDADGDLTHTTATETAASQIGTVINNGSIVATGGTANGQGGDIYFDGFGALVGLPPPPVPSVTSPGTFNQAGNGSGASGKGYAE